uniref:Uncharacterized protein n=1 Tax=Candidatus Nitrotoga fabula TaxID=2182327 RepID=A0A2X0SC94_9PROT|nr:protein of unknown function [Candidatus Nitrotoga fabula]
MVSKSELEKLLDEFLEDKICNRTPEELGKDVLSLGKKNLLLLLTKSLCVIEKQMDDIVSVQHLAKYYNLQLVNKTIERNASSMMLMKDFQERIAKEKRDRFKPVREMGLMQKTKNAKEKKARVLQMNADLLNRPGSEGWGLKKKRADHIAKRIPEYKYSYICRLIAKPRKPDQN